MQPDLPKNDAKITKNDFFCRKKLPIFAPQTFYVLTIVERERMLATN